MTRDCEDEETEPGSIADLRAEFASAADEFRARAREDIEKRADARPVAERTDAEPEPDESLQEGGLISSQPTVETTGSPDGKQQPFNPEPLLLVPHVGAGAGRPIPRRREIEDSDSLTREAIHPLESDSLSVSTAAGAEADLIEPGESYTVECTVGNRGGTPARSAVVELFVEHLPPTASVDRNAETGEFEVFIDFISGRQQIWTYTLGGTTTMAPGSQLYAVFHRDESDPPAESDILFEVPLSVSDDRTFEHFQDSIGALPRDVEEFLVDIWEISRVSDTTPGALRDSGIHLTRVDGRPVGGSVSRTLRNHNLAGEVSAGDDDGSARRRQVGTQRVSVPQADIRTVSFDYQPDADRFPNGGLDNVGGETPGAGRTVTAFHVRAYSLATNELPADWGRLAHTESRFVGRTEVSRRL